LSPYMNIDVLNSVVLGAVLPSNFSSQDPHGTMLQAVYAKGYNPDQIAISAPAYFPGYTFFFRDIRS